MNKARELPQNLANLPGTFEAEHETFVKDNAAKANTRELVAPWQGYGPYEKEMKQRILEIAKDQRNFLFSPPEDTNFQFDLKAYSQSAKAALKYDEELARMRFKLVPQHVQEPIFWRNYFYRVTLEKQAVLSSTDIDPTKHEEEEENDVLFDYAGDEDDEEKKEASKKTAEPQAKASPPKKVEKPSKDDTSKDEKKDENYDGMEEWERELRKAAGL
ncbi:hypothetical protein BJV82DRAFT_366276 [Fennellomyces sp. T-0311]|nr:hypothetical protein BJV82DRAFT_366276 [Fennellomyces sp. T-0311]